jgi:hypothetical protein
MSQRREDDLTREEKMALLWVIRQMMRATDPNRVKPRPENVHEIFDPRDYPEAAEPLANFLKERRS